MSFVRPFLVCLITLFIYCPLSYAGYQAVGYGDVYSICTTIPDALLSWNLDCEISSAGAIYWLGGDKDCSGYPTVAVSLSYQNALCQYFEDEPDTCSDGELNGDETGIDCGGGCLINCSLDISPDDFTRGTCPSPFR
jgi:hypothetical protein